MRIAFDRRAAYDAVASDYDHLFPDYSKRELWWRAQLLEVFGKATELSRLRILDLCCGTGMQSLPLAELGHSVTSIDASGGMLARAREMAAARGLAVTLIQGDCRNLTALLGYDQAFDGFVCGGASIYHFTYDELLEILSQVAIVLCQGSRGLIEGFDWEVITPATTWTVRSYRRQADIEQCALEFFYREEERVRTSLVILKRTASSQWQMRAAEFYYWTHPAQRIIAAFAQSGLDAAVAKAATQDDPVTLYTLKKV